MTASVQPRMHRDVKDLQQAGFYDGMLLGSRDKTGPDLPQLMHRIASFASQSVSLDHTKSPGKGAVLLLCQR